MESLHDSTTGPSYEVAWTLWLDSWDIALTALATATRCHTLGANEVAAHKAAITDEREAVTKQFTRLLKQVDGEASALTHAR